MQENSHHLHKTHPMCSTALHSQRQEGVRGGEDGEGRRWEKGGEEGEGGWRVEGGGCQFAIVI